MSVYYDYLISFSSGPAPIPMATLSALVFSMIATLTGFLCGEEPEVVVEKSVSAAGKVILQSLLRLALGI